MKKTLADNSLKRLIAPPPPLHEGLMPEGRWRAVKLLSSLLPTQDPVQLEKNVFRLCCTLKYKKDMVANWTEERVVSEEPRAFTEVTKTHTPSNMPAPPTVECQIKCGRCKSTQVSVEQKQTRGADESMTVFVQCENCGLRWKM